MNSAANMSHHNAALKQRENVSASANVLMCKQWWKVCWMYGDQEKYYRQLYGRRQESKKKIVCNNAQQSRFYENTECGGVVNLDEVQSGNTSGTHSLDLTREIDEWVIIHFPAAVGNILPD